MIKLYKFLFDMSEQPRMIRHVTVPGPLDMKMTMFAPMQAPSDLYAPLLRSSRSAGDTCVFITGYRGGPMERCDNLLPPWLRCFKVVVESLVLPLARTRDVVQRLKVWPVLKNYVEMSGLEMLREISQRRPGPPDGIASWKNFYEHVKVCLMLPRAARQIPCDLPNVAPYI